MKKIKNIAVFLLVSFLLLALLASLQMKHKEELRQKAALAQEIHKGMNYLMFDLSQARESSIRYVPADGLWHDRIAFIRARQGALEYLIKEGRLLRISKGRGWVMADNIISLRIRRQKKAPDILEVQVRAQKKVSLTYNLRIKLLHN